MILSRWCQGELLNKAVQEHESAVQATQIEKAAAARQEQHAGSGVGEGEVGTGLQLGQSGSSMDAPRGRSVHPVSYLPSSCE
jgi:hypothetical protein